MPVKWLPTPSNPELRVLVEENGILRRFLKFGLNLRGDGSIYISFPRKGDASPGYAWTSDDPSSIQETNPSRKGIDVSYHPSGMMNPKGFGRGPIFCEPLSGLQREQLLFVISIPSADRLDLFEKSPVGAARILCPSGVRLSFALCIAPPQHMNWSSPVLMEIDCGNVCRFGIIEAATPSLPTERDLTEHFVYLTPNSGPFGSIQLQPDEAFVRFHQHITGGREATIYGPNTKGEYLLVPTVPMRIAPAVCINFTDPELSADIIAVTNHYVRYRVRNRQRQILKDPIAIASLSLNAEL